MKCINCGREPTNFGVVELRTKPDSDACYAQTILVLSTPYGYSLLWTLDNETWVSWRKEPINSAHLNRALGRMLQENPYAEVYCSTQGWPSLPEAFRLPTSKVCW